MKAGKRNLPIFGLLILISCGAGLPRLLREDISAENNRLQEAERQLQRSGERVREDLAQAPDLFRGASAPAAWNAKLRVAREKLNTAESDGREMTRLARRGRADSRARVEQLLSAERNLRLAALDDAESVETAADKWIDFGKDLPSHLSRMKSEYDAVRAVDLEPVSKSVEQAERDWPTKKADLDNRLASLRDIPKAAETGWRATEAARQDASAGKATAPEIATLIQENELLSDEAARLPAKADDLRASCGQLYDAWDKILTDLDVSRYGRDTIYRERLKTVRTHFVDVASNKTEISSDERWIDVSEPSYDAVQNDLGMTIAHKDAGLFDSEAQTTPQPAGFAYIAPISQGSNQYGYWSHAGGESVWTFLPQYLLMRELLWNHAYRPVLIGEYTAYRTAERGGRSYYGRDPVTSAPRYGSHGTFTQTHYSQSRYLQSGGFKGSAYASHGGSGAFSDLKQSRSAPRTGSFSNGGSAGRRFGSPSGRRFGSFRSPGRSFGRRR